MAKMNMNMTGRCDTVEQLPKKGRKQMEYRFRRAQNADVDQMMEIIRDRIKWMDKQDQVAGLMALLTEDPRWAEDEPKDCYYVHHLAARSDAKGAGRALLEFCRQLSVQEGKQSIRLDCQLGNDRLNAFYESLGYLYTGPMVEGSYEGIKREKTLK